MDHKDINLPGFIKQDAILDNLEHFPPKRKDFTILYATVNLETKEIVPGEVIMVLHSRRRAEHEFEKLVKRGLQVICTVTDAKEDWAIVQD